MTPKDTTTTTPPAPAPRLIYELTVPGPVKVGGVLAYQGARLNLTAEAAAALNSAMPGALRLLGI